MSDEIESKDAPTGETAEEAAARAAEPATAFTGSGAPADDAAPTVPPAEELGTTEPGVGAAPDEPAESEPVPEPVPVGHGVVQDYVSEPGVETTHQVDGAGDVTDTTSHETAPAAGDDEAADAEDAE